MSFTAPANATGEYLVVGGGAGAGGNGSYPNVRSAGGGAGGTHLGDVTLANGPYPITIGAGGGAQINGSPTTAFGKTALGGGRGGAWSPSFPVPAPVQAGQNGGCGGGGSNPGIPVAPRTGLATDPDQGRPGGYAGPSTSGGGGGSSEIGAPGTGNPYYAHGGDGIRVNFTGTVAYYGGGGAAGYGTGGRGGGGPGGTTPSPLPGTNGTANTGGGGGGHAQTPAILVGASGGSGVVLIRYKRFQG